MDATPIPKPAIPCSVSGVLKTRSRPMRCHESTSRGRIPGTLTELFGQTHRASEDASKRDVFAKHDCGVIFGQSNAEVQKVSTGPNGMTPSRGRTSWHPGPPDTCSSCGSPDLQGHRPVGQQCLSLPIASLACAGRFPVLCANKSKSPPKASDRRRVAARLTESVEPIAILRVQPWDERKKIRKFSETYVQQRRPPPCETGES